MIDAERMLGSLVRNAMSGRRGRTRGRRRRRGRGSGGLGRSILGGTGKGALAMGALGVAIAAFEHYTKQQKPGSASSGSSSSPPPPPTPPPTAGTNVAPPPPPPPPPPAGTSSSSVAPPPPPPPSAGNAASQESPPQPPARGATAGEDAGSDRPDSDEALLLVRAMIAAANADYAVDEEERSRIMEALGAADLSDEEREFVASEIEKPLQIRDLAAAATSPELSRQIYMVSLMAIDVDTAAEEAYLARLARELDLSRADVDELEAML